MDTLPESLEPGTIVEFLNFSAIVVGDDMLLVFDSSWDEVNEGALLKFEARGPNDWVLSLSYDGGWQRLDYWIKRDWNGRVESKEYDDFGWWDWPDEWDEALEERLEIYERYDPDDY